MLKERQMLLGAVTAVQQEQRCSGPLTLHAQIDTL
jgi:hypothetical protein